ncbi:hypothetical protein BU24DRAFT_85738 [Aaosphaeria arxii CBS 175.79]|uniref:NmrA-like domain-containing protein n=1 Tax=Aaosphaeria arxii CBS 175.79 TaxID=1450172 RepID=A0A6A5X8M9_9PLEO|nr:uncharacterized protein BU24DRAFT_85738 [Aaosphaeria arxii CBS 175.79]KAF2009246.1 hypothetical protein BU24DRAFT_85738 [Aaosphaeria arxii CBS 175.79]
MAINKVLIIGNHDISSAIIDALAQYRIEGSKSFEVTALTYPSQTIPPATNDPHFPIQHKKSDFTDSSLRSSLAGQDLVISTTAAGDYHFQVRIIDAAIAAGVTRFVPNEFGQDSLNEEIQQRMPQSAQRAKVIDYLRRTSHARPDFEWCAVATGCILDTLLPSGDLGFDLQWQSASIHGTGHEFFAASSLERVGLVMASIIRRWDQTKNKYLYAAGVLTTAQSILGCLERCSEATWSTSYSDVEECVREGHSRIQRGWPDSGMFLLGKSVLFDEELRAIDVFNDYNANGLLQLEPETVSEIVEQTYRKFKDRGKPGCGCAS